MTETTLPGVTVDIWSRRVSCAEDQCLLLANLNEAEKNRYSRFTNLDAQNSFLIARGFLRQLLGVYLKIRPLEVPILSLEHGKPALPPEYGLFFNITHSQDFVLFAFAKAPVGIDVEFTSRKVDFEPVMRRFFSEKEREDWRRNSVPSAAEAFFRGWTRKEAFLKATGEGISGLGQTEISFAPENPFALAGRTDNLNISEWLFHDFIPDKEYLASVAVKSKDARFIFKK